MQVLGRLDIGECQVDVGADLKLASSTVRTILKNKEKIQFSTITNTASCVQKITVSRCFILEKIEKRVSLWKDEEAEPNMPLSWVIIMEKARIIYSHIQAQKPDEMESFLASRGWFGCFKKRNNLCNIKITGEEVSADTKAAKAFSVKLRESVERGN
ncbi:putative CENPB DNA-binding domain-containing protein 1 [Discoglossus pictus]